MEAITSNTTLLRSPKCVGLDLNFSVFSYEILNNPDHLLLAKGLFDDIAFEFITPLGSPHWAESPNVPPYEMDYVMLQVYETLETVEDMGCEQFAQMEKGTHFRNNICGQHGVCRSLWASKTLLAPRMGGSTDEAQHTDGEVVSAVLTRCPWYSTTVGAVNFPEVDWRVVSADKNDRVRM
ncbi:hypothetical protein EV122DRAFT_278602 [Schizophyllum commune]